MLRKDIYYMKKIKLCMLLSGVMIGALAGLAWACSAACLMKKPFNMMCTCIRNDVKKAFKGVEKIIT